MGIRCWVLAMMRLVTAPYWSEEGPHQLRTANAVVNLHLRTSKINNKQFPMYFKQPDSDVIFFIYLAKRPHLEYYWSLPHDPTKSWCDRHSDEFVHLIIQAFLLLTLWWTLLFHCLLQLGVTHSWSRSVIYEEVVTCCSIRHFPDTWGRRKAWPCNSKV